MTVSANPQTVIVAGGIPGTADIIATLRSANGTRLPDQEVTFSTTSGTLTPPAQTPIQTDSNGQARTVLSTMSAATVTARSGGIEATTQIQTAPANLATFSLSVEPQSMASCIDVLTLTADIRDTDGVPVPGIRVIFSLGPSASAGVSGNFNPGTSVLSDMNGLAIVTWTINASACAMECEFATGDPNDMMRGDCDIFFIADDITGGFRSREEEVVDNIP